MSKTRLRLALPGRRTVVRSTAAAAAAVLSTLGSLALAHQPATAAAPVMSETFRVATFNVLGASHTVNSTRFDTYKPRMRRTVRLINEQAFDIVGFQEYQYEQHEMFLRLTGGSWGVYPGLEA